MMRLPGRDLSPGSRIPQTGPVTERLRVRETGDDEGRRSFAGGARMFRLGEVRAIAIKFERKDGTGLPGKGKPC
jgi:hypothetical protein